MSEARERAEKKSRRELELRLGKAMAHPLRVKIVEMLNEEPAAPVDISRRLDVPLPNLSYHFRTLLELECIEEIQREQKRGSIKTTYKSRVDLVWGDLCFSGMNSKARSAITTTTLANCASRVSDAIWEGTYDARDDLHLSLQTGLVDEDGFDEIATLASALMNRFQEVVAECSDVAGEKGRDVRFPATLAMTAFESPRTYE
jgi:DNA-binding transcriptional ArsR family regulator